MNRKTLLIGLLLCSTAFSEIRWQTTRNGQDWGNCQLQTNKLTVTMHNFYADVIEEAEIKAVGSVDWGDANTLEILGDFSLSPGTAIRSLLLWNGNTILKGKLKSRAAADSAYEDVVDRDKIQVRPRDPALIEGLGNNNYRLKIYPVAINGTRKIRILYTIPLENSPEEFAYNLKPIFVNNIWDRPPEIPVEFRKGSSAADSHILSYSTVKKTVQQGAIYRIPSNMNNYSSYYYYYYNEFSLKLTPDVTSFTSAFTSMIKEGNAAGYYSAVFTSVPDSIKKAASCGLIPSGRPMELQINSGEKSTITDLNQIHAFSVYLKSSTAWDSTIIWRSYDEHGRVSFEYRQKLTPDTTNSTMLPLVWASKYCMNQKQGNLGALFGFVDQQMSLLALESDTLSRIDASDFEVEGVPPLKTNEIIIDPDQMPATPDNYIFFETTPVSRFNLNNLAFRIAILPDGRVMLQFENRVQSVVRATLFDAKGRVVQRWKDLKVNGTSLELNLPRNLKGVYFIRIESGKKVFRNRVMLH